MIHELVIWGAGGHALVVADIVRCAGKYRVIGFIDDFNPARDGEEFDGAPVFGGAEHLAPLAARGVSLLPGVGDGTARLRIVESADTHGMKLASAIHPSAIIATSAVIGDGTVAAAGVIVNPRAVIGRGVILNTACSVDHECNIADGAHISPGARLAGRVSVARGAWVGIGAVVRQSITIGPDAIVGAGAVVVRDVAAGHVVVGNPARFLKNNPRATHTS